MPLILQECMETHIGTHTADAKAYSAIYSVKHVYQDPQPYCDLILYGTALFSAGHVAAAADCRGSHPSAALLAVARTKGANKPVAGIRAAAFTRLAALMGTALPDELQTEVVEVIQLGRSALHRCRSSSTPVLNTDHPLSCCWSTSLSSHRTS